MRACLLVAAAACGSQPAPGRTATTRPPPAAPTCSEVGVILRGPVDVDAETAGPAREAAIASACETDRWGPAVVACVTSQPAPKHCLDRLSADQRTSYQAKLDGWTAQFGGDSYGDPVGTTADVGCDEVVADPAAYPPVPTGDGAWTVAARRLAIRTLCDHDAWGNEVKSCIADGDPVASCLDKLPAGSRMSLAARLAELDELAAKIATASKRPASITCAKVVAVHYADAAWRTKLDGVKPTERKQQIARSRDRMTKACAAQSWDDALRACVVVGGGDVCFEAAGLSARWGFPATVEALPAECADLKVVVDKAQLCTQLPQSLRDQVKQGYDVQVAAWSNSEVAAGRMAQMCKDSADLVRAWGTARCGW